MVERISNTFRIIASPKYSLLVIIHYHEIFKERILICIPYHGIVIIIDILDMITIYIFLNAKLATSSKTI